ncbi:hypothetical protein ACJ73_01528 [Blastomyces percursus]|uniref:NB-ARC domain-containing protein n=1 Tax=Blastomyces percursus TaxID=1658174 RepID=A0A1J9QF33_9EURO|nr:hypothetical protein ACJ73_01528 [Blastomyces percursus]
MLRLWKKKRSAAGEYGPEGLTTLWPLKYDSSKINLDVVAIHGLNGGSMSTWSRNDKLWLRDFLPSTFPSARIMTFGYNANLFADCASGRITDFANNLIAMLAAERQKPTEKQRPILFICHSMGGLVVKRALTIARNRATGADLRQAQIGLVFLATPHRGSGTASLADVGTKLMKALQLGKPNTKSANELKEFSSTVQDIHSDFIDIGAQYNVLSFFELKGYPALGLIVDEWSARMDTENEKYRIGLAATHTDICQFSSESDGNYKIMIGQLEMFVRQFLLDATIPQRSSDTTNQFLSTLPLPAPKNSQYVRSTHSRDLSWQGILGQICASDNIVSTSAGMKLVEDHPAKSNSLSTAERPHLPNRLPYFFEQGFCFRDEELRMIDEHFRDDKYKIPAFGIYGEGGVGKTQIALGHIYSQNNRTYKAIFWFHADTDDKLANDCDAITIQLGLQRKRSSLEEGPRLFNIWLQENNDWLLVFDNVEHMDMVAPYWPTSIGSKGYIIVTSRNTQIARAPLTMSKEIESFSTDDGAKMLLSGLDSYSPDEEKVAYEITAKLGGLPLAIHHMACFATDRMLSLSDVLKLYEEEESMVIEADVHFGQDRTLATVWSLSISTLSEQSLELLDTISLFDPDSIPTQLIEHFNALNAPDISSAFTNLGSHFKAMSNLHSRSLVRKKGPRTSQILSIHRLIQSAVRRPWTDSQKLTAFQNAAFCISQVYPRQIKGQSLAEMYSECATYNSHMLSIHKFYCANKDKLIPTLEYAEILAHCGWYYYERAQLNSSMDVLTTAKEICLQLTQGKMNATLGLVYNNIACVYAARRQREENMKYINLSIRHREASLSRDDPEIQQLGISYMNYANVLQSRSVRRVEEADMYYKKALEIRETCPGGTPEGLELTLTALGSFKFIAGDVKGAQPYIERAIKLRPLLKVDTTFTLHTLYVYGSIQWELGEREEAYKSQLRCLEGMKKLEGESHFMTGVSYHKIGCLAHMMGKELEAIENLVSALKTFRAVDTAPGFVPRTCLVLGKVLIERGQRLGDDSIVAEGTALKQEGSDLAFAITGRRDNMETERDFDELVARSYR